MNAEIISGLHYISMCISIHLSESAAEKGGNSTTDNMNISPLARASEVQGGNFITAIKPNTAGRQQCWSRQRVWLGRFSTDCHHSQTYQVQVLNQKERSVLPFSV